jgi:signal transduction histidine kinase/ligand-binding sensor domain-containing protein
VPSLLWKTSRWFWVLAVAIALPWCTLNAADDNPWRVRVWNDANGLAGNNVRSVLQSTDGFLWVVAGGKLSRFDGMRFEHFPLTELGDRAETPIRLAMSLRAGGFALVLTDGTLVRLSATRTESLTPNLAAGRVESMIEEQSGALLLNFDNDLVYRWHQGALTRLTASDGLPPGSGSSTGDGLRPGLSPNAVVTADTRGQVWIARTGLVGKLEGPKFETRYRVPDQDMKMTAARSGGLWITSGLQLLRWDANGVSHAVGRIPAVSSAHVSTLLEDRAGAVWIGTHTSGLFRYHGGTFQSIPISHREVITVVEDRENNLWVGTARGGLNLVQPRTLKIEGAETGLPFQAVQAIDQDRNGALWAVTQEGTFVKRVGDAWQNVLPDGQDLGAEATCLAADHTGAIWLGGVNHHVFRWDRGVLTRWGRNEGITSLVIRTLLVSKAGDVWVAGGLPGTLQRFRRGQPKNFTLPVSVASIWTIAEGVNGDIWVGGSRGLLLRVTSDDRVIDETPRTERPMNSIRTLHMTADGTLWIGYEQGGVGRRREESFHLITSAHGLLDDNLRQIISDGQGWLWIIALKNLFKVRQSDFDQLAVGARERLRPVHYGEDHGVSMVLGGTAGALLSREGLLWFPLATSLAIANPKLEHRQREPLPVFVTRVAVDDKVAASYGSMLSPRAGVALGSTPLRLAPDHRRVEVDFTAISFSAPKAVRFQYRLEGLDGDWTDAGVARRAAYGRLPAGEYRFRVKASNSDGLWNETGATTILLVQPFWWERWWFRTSLVVLFTAAVFAATRYVSFRRLRVKLRALEQATALEQERARIARDIHDDLGGRLTRIMLLSRLALRDGNVPPATTAQVREISESAQHLMRALDETVWAVNPRNDDLPNLITYMSHYALKFLRTAGIECVLELPDDPPNLNVSAEVRHHVYMAVKEALTNVVRHAKATQVTLRVTVAADALHVLVEDNGGGFEGPSTGDGGNGLTNMTQRMAQVGGEFAIESRRAGGTRVTLKIGLPRAK